MKKLVKIVMSISLILMFINVVSARQETRKSYREAAPRKQSVALEQRLNLSETQQKELKSSFSI